MIGICHFGNFQCHHLGTGTCHVRIRDESLNVWLIEIYHFGICQYHHRGIGTRHLGIRAHKTRTSFMSSQANPLHTYQYWVQRLTKVANSNLSRPLLMILTTKERLHVHSKLCKYQPYSPFQRLLPWINRILELLSVRLYVKAFRHSLCASDRFQICDVFHS